jgi:predicted GTPase
MSNKHFTDELVNSINEDKTLDEVTKTKVLRNLTKLKDTKVNILITGATGCGKSSTINALFNSEKAKVGQGVDPETMDIAKYELENIVLFDSPGLGLPYAHIFFICVSSLILPSSIHVGCWQNHLIH